MATFDKKWFNPLYFILNDILKDQSVRLVLVYGGKSSSKTVSIAQILSKESYINRVNCIAFRKESVTIKTTLKKSFELAISSMWLKKVFVNMEFMFRSINRTEIVLKGLDSEEKAKGIESYKYLYIDELNHFLKEEFQQFNLSLRGMPGQKIIASWNPVSIESWVKTELIDTYQFVDTQYKLPCESSFVKISTCGSVVLIKTTYQDNFWIVGSPNGDYGFKDNNLIAEYNKLQKTDLNSYRVNVLGEWGQIRTGGEFWKDFDSNKHTTTIGWNKVLPLHIVWDENVNPYLTCEVWQVNGKQAIQIDEICLSDPRNRVKDVCAEFQKRYPLVDVKGLFVYGDRTSIKEDTKFEKGENFFTKILEFLKYYRPILRMQSVNPSVVQSGGFINDIYAGRQPISILINNRCTKSLYDYQYALEDSDGTLKKSTKKNPQTGVVYQEFGHCFIGSTLIETIEGLKAIKDIQKKDLVLTRKGYKPVNNLFLNGYKKICVYKLKISNFSIIIECTPNHKILTTKGWLKLEQLTSNETIFLSRNLMENSTIYTKGRNTLLNTAISCTETNGSSITDLHPKDGIYTTKTTIPSTMTYQTLRRYQVQNIYQHTVVKETEQPHCEQLTMPEYLQMNGTAAKKARNFIVRSRLNSGKISNRNNTLVNAAQNYLNQRRSSRSSARITANLNIEESRELIMKQESALHVPALSLSTNTQKQNVAVKSVLLSIEKISEREEFVYDIEVNEQHEYFANGVLVHNCSDAKRYLITEAFKSEYIKYLNAHKTSNAAKVLSGAR